MSALCSHIVNDDDDEQIVLNMAYSPRTARTRNCNSKGRVT